MLGTALRQLEGRLHGAARPGTLQVWAEPFTSAARAEALQPAHRPLRAGRHHVEHLLRLDDPTASTSIFDAHAITTKFLETFKEFPPRQKPASVHHRPGRRKAEAMLLAQSLSDGPQLTSPGPTGRRSRRSPTSSPGSPRRVDATTSSPPPESRSSTTTARCGARSRCRSSWTSRSAGFARAGRRRPQPCATGSRTRRPTRATMHWMGAGRW